MVKKRKLRYKNFNICQLVDKGKLKLQYTDEFKETKKNFGKKSKNSKTKKCVIKNVNTKLISSILAFTLITTLSGCNTAKDFEYKRSNTIDNDVIEITGTMDSDIVSDLKIIELKVFDENYLFLARRYDKGTNKNGKWAYTYEYYDVFEDYKIVSFTDLVDQRIDNREITEGVYLVKESSLNDYLSYYGYKDKEYTPKKLKKIFYDIKAGYEFEEEKKLVKE